MKKLKTVGITGASGTLGKALTKIFRNKGYRVIGFTNSGKNLPISNDSANEWIQWECGKENLLEKHLNKIDLLILNHGIYEQSDLNSSYEKSLEINALSKFKLLNLFEKTTLKIDSNSQEVKEIWINTSEAELLPALNPSYEVSKSLIGQLVSFKRNLNDKKLQKKLIIKKIILGPFKSKLNPIGIMNPDFVSKIIYSLASLDIFLIIVSPNPLTYLIFPIKELYFFFYCKFLKIIKLFD